MSRPIALTAFLLCAAALTYAAVYRFLWASWPEWPRVDGLPLDRWFWSGEAMLGGLTTCAATMSWSWSCPRPSPNSAGVRSRRSSEGLTT